MGGIVRSDIRSSFAGMSGSADGVPLTIRIQLVGVDLSCAALAGYAIYVWHCDRVGGYSLYTAAEQNYLRGVQATGADGIAAFNSIFPGAYSGRWPHVHFEIYPDVASATSSSRKLITSQLALPEAVCNDVYATSGYEQSMNNLAQSSLDSDSVFRDGYDQQLAAVTGNVTDGYVANLTLAIAA